MKTRFSHLRKTFNSLALLLIFGALNCSAFSPTLQDVLVFGNTTSPQYVVTNLVTFQVYDPVRQQWMYGTIATLLDPLSPVAILNQAGIVACYDGAGQVAMAVYDPNVGSWEYSFGSWSGGAVNLVDNNGVVTWDSFGDSYVHFATYDPTLATWRFGTGPGAYVVPACAYGVVAYTGSGLGAVFAVYDPSRETWETGSVNSDNITINTGGGSVSWGPQETNYTMGYSQPSGSWINGTTGPYASFAVSQTSGSLPATIWFTDMSIGSLGWQWNFGDGSSSTARSTNHVYFQGGNLTPLLTVTGAGGTSSASQTIALPPWYAVTNNNTITITRYSGPGGAVTVPNTINGLTVTAIGDYAFEANNSITTVTISDNVSSVGEEAFAYCKNLANVNTGDGVVDIGNAAFYECTSLASVILGSRVATIGQQAFEICTSLTNIILPNSVITIGDEAFASCQAMTSATFGNSLTTIGNSAFGGCSVLTNVTIPDSVTSIGNTAFGGDHDFTSVLIPDAVTNIGNAPFEACYNLTNIAVSAQNADYSSLAGVLFNKSQTTLIQFPCAGSDYYIVPSSVNQIASNAFWNCVNLSGITIPNGVASIGEEAFYGCYHLPNLMIPASVTNIGEAAFNVCLQLTNISVDIGNPSYCSLNGVLFDKTQRTLIQYPLSSGNSAYTIPNGVTLVKSGAFASCSYLVSVTLPSSIVTIGDYAFESCYDLSQLYVEGNAPSIDSTVFVSTDSTVYYLPGTYGWGVTFGGLPTQLWFKPQPAILSFEPSFGMHGNQFGFTVSWATNASVIIQASTNLASSLWIPIATNNLSNGTNYFTDPQWTNYDNRYYRVRAR